MQLIKKLKNLKNAPNTNTTPNPTSNAPKAYNGKGAKVGVFGTYKAKAKCNPRNSRG